MDFLGVNLQLWSEPPARSDEELRAELAHRLTGGVDWSAALRKEPIEARLLLLAAMAWPKACPPEPDQLILGAFCLYHANHTTQRAPQLSEQVVQAFATALGTLTGWGLLYVYVRRSSEDSPAVRPALSLVPGDPIGALYQHARSAGLWRSGSIALPLEIALSAFPALIGATKLKLVVTDKLTPARADGAAFLYDLVQVACAARQAGLRLTMKGPLYKRDQDMLQARFLLRDAVVPDTCLLGPAGDKTPLRLRFLLACAGALNLLELKGDVLVVNPVAEQWLALPPAEQLRSLGELWLNYVAAAEPGIRFLLAAIFHTPADKWLDLTALLKALYYLETAIVQFSRATTYAPAGQGTALALLVYLGLLEVAMPQKVAQDNVDPVALLCKFRCPPEGTVWLRLTPAGREFLAQGTVSEKEPPFQPAPGPPFVVQPNYEIVVQPLVKPALHWRLSEVADLVRPDRAYVYRLSQASVFRALRAGWTGEDILRFLATGQGAADHAANAAAGRPGQAGEQARKLPQNVAYSIREWSQGYGRCTVMRIAIVQCESKELADQVLTSGILGDLVVGRASDTALVVRDDALKQVIKLLEKAGLPPPAEPVYVTEGAVAARYGMGIRATWE